MNGRLVSLAAGVLPMLLYAWFLYYLDRYEKEPLKLLLGIFLWGALIAAGSAFVINSLSSIGIYLFTRNQFATQLATAALIAPFVEETLKGIAVLIVFLLFRSEFDSPLDGIVYGGIAALGFAATENVWYIHQFGFLPNGFQGLLEISLVRIVLVGWQHPFYTAFTGLGFALARRSKNSIWRWLFPLFGWGFAVAFHLLHNLFTTFVFRTSDLGSLNLVWDWSGYLGLLGLILLLIKREQSWMKEHLLAERDQGVISLDQYQTACSAWKQSLAFAKGLKMGNYALQRRFYQACGDLMHKKRHLSRHGDQLGEALAIKHLRSELSSLAETLR